MGAQHAFFWRFTCFILQIARQYAQYASEQFDFTTLVNQFVGMKGEGQLHHLCRALSKTANATFMEQAKLVSGDQHYYGDYLFARNTMRDFFD